MLLQRFVLFCPVLMLVMLCQTSFEKCAACGGAGRGGMAGTPRSPAEDCRPLHSRFSLTRADRYIRSPTERMPPAALSLFPHRADRYPRSPAEGMPSTLPLFFHVKINRSTLRLHKGCRPRHSRFSPTRADRYIRSPTERMPPAALSLFYEAAALRVKPQEARMTRVVGRITCSGSSSSCSS